MNVKNALKALDIIVERNRKNSFQSKGEGEMRLKVRDLRDVLNAMTNEQVEKYDKSEVTYGYLCPTCHAFPCNCKPKDNNEVYKLAKDLAFLTAGRIDENFIQQMMQPARIILNKYIRKNGECNGEVEELAKFMNAVCVAEDDDSSMIDLKHLASELIKQGYRRTTV